MQDRWSGTKAACQRVSAFAGALFLWDEAAAKLSASELQADAAYVVLTHGAARLTLRVRCLLLGGHIHNPLGCTAWFRLRADVVERSRVHFGAGHLVV